jgi:urease accessory protein
MKARCIGRWRSDAGFRITPRGENVLAKLPADSATFAGNRAVGRIELSVGAEAHGNSRRRVREQGSLRVRFPNVAPGSALDAVIINTAGGMTGGDRFDLDFEVGAGARLTVSTAAAEKIYRSLGTDTVVNVRFVVGAGATLAWLPQETILFDRMRLRRSIEADLAADAQLFIAEMLVFGRSAMGEMVERGYLFDRWRIRAGGALVFAESLRLDGAIAENLAQRAAAGGGCAIASVLKFPASDADIGAVRQKARNFASEVGISTFNGLALARLVAADGAALRRDLIGVLTALGIMPLPRLWLN